jgi:pyruvate/2-oxoacid:ferredoxin oxidoreductase alpha subunit
MPRYVEPLFRPPSEAHSLIFQITLGCSQNQCRFCGMYKTKQFHIRPLQEILAEIAGIPQQYRSRIDRVFLADGDALVYPFEEYLLEDADVVVVAYGSTSRSARYAVNIAREQGIKAGMFRIKTFWPFPDKQIKALANKVKGIVIPEMNLGMCSLELERCAQGKVPVLGIFRVDGEPINPDQILAKIKEVK